MKAMCDTCKNVRACQAAFGRFWADKSSGGRGCDTPFAPARTIPPPPVRKTRQEVFI